MAGTIRKRGNRWQVRAYAGRDPETGQPRYLYDSAETREGARALLPRLLEQGEKERSVKRRLTVSQTWDLYMSVAGPKGQASRPVYETNFRLHLEPDLGRRWLGDLTTGDLNDLYVMLQRPKDQGGHGLGPATTRKVHVAISAMLTWALSKRYVATHAGRGAVLPSSPKSTVRAASAADIQRVLDVIAEDDAKIRPAGSLFGTPFGLLVTVAAVTGARRAENCALQWGDIDWTARTVTIQRRVVASRDRRGKDGPLVVAGTKTVEQRVIAVDAGFLALLEERLMVVKAELALRNEDLRPEAYIFTKYLDGRQPWDPTRVCQRLRKYREQAMVRSNVTFGGLRHYAATEMIGGNIDVKVAAKRLGNSPTVCLNFYAEVLDERDRAAAELLGRRLKPASTTTVESGVSAMSTEELLAEVARRMGGSS